jgi:hypothetical protein
MEPVTKHHENILRMKKVVNNMSEKWNNIFFENLTIHNLKSYK